MGNLCSTPQTVTSSGLWTSSLWRVRRLFSFLVPRQSLSCLLRFHHLYLFSDSLCASPRPGRPGKPLPSAASKWFHPPRRCLLLLMMCLLPSCFDVDDLRITRELKSWWGGGWVQGLFSCAVSPLPPLSNDSCADVICEPPTPHRRGFSVFQRPDGLCCCAWRSGPPRPPPCAPTSGGSACFTVCSCYECWLQFILNAWIQLENLPLRGVERVLNVSN